MVGMRQVTRKVVRKKFGPVLKKYTKPRPSMNKTIPPTFSDFQAMIMGTSNNNHGNAFGLFLINPLIPPPYFSAPEKTANTAIVAMRIVSMVRTKNESLFNCCAVYFIVKPRYNIGIILLK